MSNISAPKLPVWFWVVAIVAILWNLVGVYAYYADVTMSPETIAAYPEKERALIEGRPSWLFGVYAIAVFAGLFGSVGLALKRNWAVPIFGVSIAAIVLQMGYVLFVMNAIGILGASAAIFPGIIFVIGAFLLWFSLTAKNKGWLR